MPKTKAAPVERFPRRAQKRQNTRARILSSAMKLFSQMGYGATTMNAIAEAADIHITTLFTHFKTKRDLATSLNDASVEILVSLIDAAKGKVPFFEFFREIVLSTAKGIEGESDPGMTLWHEMERDPELSQARLIYEQRQVTMFADYIAAEFKLDRKTDYRPMLVASLMLSSSWISHRRWSEQPKKLNLEKETLKALTVAEKMARSILP